MGQNDNRAKRKKFYNNLNKFFPFVNFPDKIITTDEPTQYIPACMLPGGGGEGGYLEFCSLLSYSALIRDVLLRSKASGLFHVLHFFI